MTAPAPRADACGTSPAGSVSRDGSPADDRARARPRARGARAARRWRSACPVVTRRRHQRQGIDLARCSRRCCAPPASATGLYTSPHLLRYNERVRIAGREATDEALVAAFGAVEDARTATDAGAAHLLRVRHARGAGCCSRAARPTCSCSRSGLGGRLDAVNVDRRGRGGGHERRPRPPRLPRRHARGDRPREGGHLPARDGSPCAGTRTPRNRSSTRRRASARDLYVAGRDFTATAEGTQWRYSGTGQRRASDSRIRRCAAPTSSRTRRARSRRSIHCATGFRSSAGALRDGLVGVELPGRFQVLPGRPTPVLDVAHNPQAARALASCLASMGYHPQTHAVVGMLADKDIDGVVAALRGQVDRWTVAPLPGPRGASAQSSRMRSRGPACRLRRCAPRPTSRRVAGGGRRGGRG